MFSSYILPIQITVGILLTATILLTLLAPLFRCARFTVFLAMMFVSGAAFFPLVGYVHEEVGKYRYGIFQYANAADIHDYHFDDCMPPAATAITTDEYEMGSRAMFTIEEVDLKNWLDASWSKYVKQSIGPRAEEQVVSKAQFEPDFEGLNWELPDNAVLFSFPIAPDGATVDVWYDAEKKTAFTKANYW